MSDTWINIRIGAYHFQCFVKSHHWERWRFGYNPYWKDWKWLEKPIEICQLDWSSRKN